MKIGSKQGSTGVDVARLHRVLAASGLSVEGAEVARRAFGPSTLAALHELQRRRGLPVVDEIDETTLSVLLDIEQNITINVNEGVASPTPQPDPTRGKITGTLVDGDGNPVPAIRVVAFAQSVRQASQLGEGKTNASGTYTIQYARKTAVNVFVRADDDAGNVLATSPTSFSAPAQVVINFTTAKDGIVRTVSLFSSLQAKVTAQLQGTPLSDLKENKDTHEIRFVANAVGAPFANVAYLYMAHVLGTKNALRDETLFGIFYEAIPAALGPALTNLPDSGIDDTFLSQAFAGVVAHARSALAQALATAVSTNVLPASYADTQDLELSRIDDLRVQATLATPYIRGKTPLSSLLAAGNTTSAVQTAFVAAFAANGGRLGPTWKALRANKSLSTADLATLNTTLSVGELLTGNLPLVNDTLQRLAQKTLARVSDLALLDENDWIARITALDPQAASIPSVLPNDTPATRIARFAKALTERFAGRYPSTAFVGGLTKAQSSSFQTKAELISVLTANPSLNLKKTNIDQYVATKKVTISAPALAELKSAQRLFRISPHYVSVEALKSNGYLSAQSVYFTGRAPFLAKMTAALGSASLASMAYARAQMTYASALMMFGRYNLGLNTVGVAAAASNVPPPGSVAGFPDLQALFGTQDYFTCEDCLSTYSPAAYLVDLLQYLRLFGVKPLPGVGAPFTGFTSALDPFLYRRPEVPYIALTCNNTNVTLPYIDLVNEILETVIAPPPPPPPSPPYYIETMGTSAERRALPQNVSQGAYVATAGVVFPLTLPFDLPFAQTTAYLAAMGTSRPAIMTLFVGTPGGPSATDVACASMGINPEMHAVLAESIPLVSVSSASPILVTTAIPHALPTGTQVSIAGVTGNGAANGTFTITVPPPAAGSVPGGSTTFTLNGTTGSGTGTGGAVSTTGLPWLRWGFSTSAPTNVPNPETPGTTFNPTDWVAALNVVPVLLNRAALTLPQLYQLLEVVWVTQSSVSLSLGVDPSTGLVSSDTGLMKFTGLTGAVLDRAQAFLRLATATGLQMWELDWALGTSALNDAFLVFIANAVAVKNRLNLPLQEVLTFWAPLQTRDVTNHLGTEDTVVPSTYSEVFANPTMLASWASVFPPAPQPPGTFDLDGTALIPSQSNATPAESANLNATIAALGISAADVATILTAANVTQPWVLDLATVNVLLRYQRLASSLSLSVSDLVLWIQLTAGTPFGTTPADTLEFLRRLSVLQSTGLAVHDLDYLLRNQSVSQSAIAFTTTEATATLQSIRAAVAKLTPAQQQDGVSIPGIFVGALATATAVTSNVVTPLLTRLGVLPLSATATGNLAAPNPFVDPTMFPVPMPQPPNPQWVASASVTGGGATANTLDGNENTFWTTGVAEAAGQWFQLNMLAPTSFSGISLDAGQVGTFPAAFTVSVSSDGTTWTQVATGTGSSQVVTATFPAQTAQYVRITLTAGASGDWSIAELGVYVSDPTFVNAFTTVGRGAALFAALKPTEIEFAFVVQNAATFGWLDPSALPTSTTSPYQAFEALVRALKLDSRQAARTPKLFDVLGQWLVPGQLPATLAAAIQGTATVPPLAQALDGAVADVNAAVADMTAIATQLGAKAPSITAATQPGTLADIAMLTSIADALDVVARYRIAGTTLVSLAAAQPSSDTANAAFGAFQAQYTQSAWYGAVQPVEDGLRQTRRDALVAYLLGPGANVIPQFTFFTSDDVYDYFLIDPEMCACAITTRLLQASLAIQQFVQQCFLNLNIQVTVDTTNSSPSNPWNEWSWRQQYRLWQANREVFLYPENYVLPELRTTASEFFTDMENDLRQSNCDADLAQAAMESYLRKLVEVSQLVVAAHYNETTAAGPVVLHVFAHTRGAPWVWYYRTRTTTTPGGLGVWTAWQKMDLDITSDQVVPVIWDQRLHLVWLVFKPQAEKARDQSVPAGGGGTSSAPAKYWAVDVAMSELSAGQWQPKRVLTEKMFFSKTITGISVDQIDRPPVAFTLRASQDPSFDLVVTVYYNLSAAELSPAMQLELAEVNLDEVEVLSEAGLAPAGAVTAAEAALQSAETVAAFGFGSIETLQVASGTLAMPEAPLVVEEDPRIIPDMTLVDLAHEPTRALVTTSSFNGSLSTPAGYNFSAQDLVWGYYYSANPGPQPLNVLAQTTATGQPTTIELLGRVINPRIVVPPQETVFDSLDPFFVVDSGGGSGSSARPPRTYLVQPEFYTVSSSPQELDSLAYVKQWTTRYEFLTFYHPYARTMLRELEIGGIPRLMSRSLQTNPQNVRGWSPTFDFASLFQPQPPVATPYPGQPGAIDVGESALDFSAGSSGAYSLYNWEVFYHAPMFVAALLSQNQQYQDATTWYEYIFNPTDSSGGPAPQRFWEMAPFYQMNANDWMTQQIATIMKNITTGAIDTDTQAAINAYLFDPFDPHAIASLRIAAYAKATVMKFLDNLIAWGDSLFTTYTAETVSQAEQLYVLADMILGPQPAQVKPPPTSATSSPVTYAQIESQLNPSSNAFSNVLVAVENLVVAPEPPAQVVEGTGATPTLPQLPSKGQTFLFCIPPNSQLLSYWTTVADRLYKIRHCMNLQGQVVPLPLYAPPINPLLAAEAAASGQTPSGLTPPPPIYRFATYLRKAVDLANDVRAFGALILSALEKEDAESLALLRANQELDIQTRMLDVKTQQVQEATDQIAALQNQMAISQTKLQFYQSQTLMNASETQAMSLNAQALTQNQSAISHDTVAVYANLAPGISAGVAGFGGTVQLSVSYGGSNIASSESSTAGKIRSQAGVLSQQGTMASTTGGYQHRLDEWQLQAQIAQGEITQIQSQIVAANDRLTIANTELSIQNEQIDNAQAITTFLTNKYTNAQLYDWMVTQLTTVYTQAYQLAYGLAQQAQSTYQYELGRYQDTFLQPTYWDSQHRGLTAGESLLFDLRRMETQYLAQNVRELELTKHVSLAITQPLALVQLMETGSCSIYLDEAMFDADHPGQYFRRLRSVALTIPCVTGPYTGVNANLTLNTAVLRTTSTLPSSGYVPATPSTPPTDFATFSVSTPPNAMISTSSGQNDAGLFEVNLRDERWLPFEGQGAVSAWTLELNPASNSFDFSTITDVVLHVRYTARLGIAENTVLAAIAPPSGVARSIIVSVKNTFGDALYRFFNPTSSTATNQVLTLPISNALFPWSNVNSPKIADILVFFMLSAVPTSGTSVTATLAGGGQTYNVPLGTSLPGGWTGTPAILSADPNMNASIQPQQFTLTVPVAGLPSSLTVTPGGLLDPSKVTDVVLVINYVS